MALKLNFFTNENYARYSELVDRAARLDAFKLIDVKICQTLLNLEDSS